MKTGRRQFLAFAVCLGLLMGLGMTAENKGLELHPHHPNDF